MEAAMAEFSQSMKEAKQHNDYWEFKARHRFALQLLRVLKSQEISQSEFAQRAGVSAGYVSRVLSGGENLSIRTLVKLCRALDLTLDIQANPQAPVFQRKHVEDQDWSLLEQALRRKHGSPQINLMKPESAVNEHAYVIDFDAQESAVEVA